MTFFRIAGLTLAPGVKVRETADCDTPANLATSFADEACRCFAVASFIKCHQWSLSSINGTSAQLLAWQHAQLYRICIRMQGRLACSDCHALLAERRVAARGYISGR